jgi:hypothetical protein
MVYFLDLRDNDADLRRRLLDLHEEGINLNIVTDAIDFGDRSKGDGTAGRDGQDRGRGIGKIHLWRCSGYTRLIYVRQKYR